MDADEAIELDDDNEFDLDDNEDQDDQIDYGQDQEPSDEDGDDEFAQNNKDMQDFGLNEPQDDEPEEDSDEYGAHHQEEEQPQFPQSSGFKQPESNSDNEENEEAANLAGAKKVENQAHDVEFELDDSEEIDTEEDNNGDVPPENMNQDAATGAPRPAGEEYNDEAPEGAYNPADYANLNVGADVRELFEYIGRYKPSKIDLETTFRPFIPEFIPHVGEVDAFIKMPKPDKSSETLGIEVLDEPNLNCTDKAVLEMKYIQLKKTTKKVEMQVHSIENAEKNPKEIQKWIKSVSDLNQSRPPATVQYTKPMPDFDKLMEEWPSSMEHLFKEIQFPGPELDVQTGDYAKIMSMLLDIPVHANKGNKGLIEALHVMFTLYSDFKENQHFQNKAGDENGDEGNGQSMQF